MRNETQERIDRIREKLSSQKERREALVSKRKQEEEKLKELTGTTDIGRARKIADKKRDEVEQGESELEKAIKKLEDENGLL